MGKNNGLFSIYKFRTMTDKERKVDRKILKGDPEVTKVGAVLRRLKIDELPQLINILKGDMAIVGPRPAIPNQVKSFNEDGKFRTKVRPGLTGLAQTNGNIYLTWEERWVYDRLYVESVSFFLDIKLIFKTILIVLMGEEKFVNKPNI